MSQGKRWRGVSSAALNTAMSETSVHPFVVGRSALVLGVLLRMFRHHPFNHK